MLIQLSKEVLDLRKSSRHLLTALERQGPTVAEELARSVRGDLEPGDQEPNFFAPIRGQARRLDGSLDRLLTSDQRVYSVKVRLKSLRDDRDEVTSTLGKEIVRMRHVVLGQYEEPDIEGLALQSPRVRRADPLLRQSEMIDERFARDDLEDLLGTPAYDEVVDPRKPVDRLLRVADELRALLERIDLVRRELDEAIIEKDRLKAEHEALLGDTARSFEASCRLAGLRELADKVRSSARRRQAEAEVDEGSEDSGPPHTDSTDTGLEDVVGRTPAS